MKKLGTPLFLLHWVLIPLIAWPLRGSHVNFAAALHILAHVTAFLGIAVCNQLFALVRVATKAMSSDAWMVMGMLQVCSSYLIGVQKQSRKRAGRLQD
ncbi:styx-b [Symbiodinium pilosum]|uniref:Styx-b protein n=1 Tax=Symbiodinium pilosum TaxID=2952 RepID=A0A812V8P7_SYMPI|nr:styx-b [Symbiodinium pilosum]